jgi:hypothetical protein
MPVRPWELSVSAVLARTEALLNRDAISQVNRLTTSFANSSAIGASVQDDTMHAPFAALVEWNVRENYVSRSLLQARVTYDDAQHLSGAELLDEMARRAPPAPLTRWAIAHKRRFRRERDLSQFGRTCNQAAGS